MGPAGGGVPPGPAHSEQAAEEPRILLQEVRQISLRSSSG